MFSKRIIFSVILLGALMLRFYAIDRIPPALSWDEVSIGYNAYSILKTGQDEHGKFLPLGAFTAYGDYKPPLAIYLTVPSIAIFGLNEFGVRFPSALFGTLTILMTFFLVRELFRITKNYELITNNLPLLSAAILAISPWHINLSRAGFEANIALFFVVLGAWVILKARENRSFWIIAWIPYALSMYTFNSSRYFVVLFSIGLLIYCWGNMKKAWKHVGIGLAIAAIIIIPLIPHLLSKEARLRFVEVNIFSDSQVVKTANERIEREKGSLIGKIINNRRIGYTRSYLLHFFDNLQPDFLFIRGDGNPKFSIQDVGQLYIMEAPLLVIGIFALLIFDWKVGLLLLYWIIAAIIPAATARETPHALRILNSLPTWQIFIAYGILSITVCIKQLRTKNQELYLVIYIFFLVALYSFSAIYYIHNYFCHYPIEYSAEWQYGYREAINYANQYQNVYKKIVMTDNIGRPYMYTLFYTKTDPALLLETKKSYFDAAGFYHVDGFGKYQFGGALPGVLEPEALYIWDAGNVPKGARILNTVELLNGNPVLVLFDNGAVTQ